MNKNLRSWLETQNLTEGLPPIRPAGGEAPAAEPPAVPVPQAPVPEPNAETPTLDIPNDEPVTDDPGLEPESGESLGREPTKEDDTSSDESDEELELLNFEDFREDYIDLSVNKKPEELLDRLDDLRGIVDLGPKEKKFVSDNIQILLLMGEQEIHEAYSKLHHIGEPFDLLDQLSEILDKSELLRNVIIKLPSFFGMKSDLYRKYIAALMGAVQVGGGGTVEDLVLAPTKGQRILFSTRFYTTFGHVQLIPWSLNSGDTDLFLKDIEKERLEKGSPEEKAVLLKRVLLSSISKLAGGRIFLICISNRPSGRRFDIGIQLDQFLNNGYERGLLSIEIEEDTNNLVVLPNGEPVNPGKLIIKFKDKGQEGGSINFLELKHGTLMLTADQDQIEKAVEEIGSSSFHRAEFDGSVEELNVIQRCVPTLQEMLLKRC